MLAGLKEQALKLTPQRRTIIEILTRDGRHPSALDVFLASREVHPRISLSTVYSTLSLLKRLGLVKELEFETMDNRYDMDTTPHINLICTRCGRIEDFTGLAPIPHDLVERQTGFKVRDIRHEYYGVCSDCSR